MCADRPSTAAAAAAVAAASHQNGADPMNIQITIDITDIYDGALKVLKRVKPFWPTNNVKFKVSLLPIYRLWMENYLQMLLMATNTIVRVIEKMTYVVCHLDEYDV